MEQCVFADMSVCRVARRPAMCGICRIELLIECSVKNSSCISMSHVRMSSCSAWLYD